MGEIKIGDRPVSDYSDDDLAEFLRRRSKKNKPRADAITVWAAIIRAFDEIGTPMSVRQMFYALSVRGHVQKTEQGYKRVAYRLLQMRRLGIIPYSFISDNTRWMRKPKACDSLSDFLDSSQEFIVGHCGLIKMCT